MPELLIPVKKRTARPGRFSIPRRLAITSVHDADALPIAQLAADLRSQGVAARFVKSDPRAPVCVRRSRSLQNPEAYELRITPAKIDILAGTAQGAYYGVQTLRELIRIHGTRLPCCRVEDWPTFARRGVYHDCARGRVPKVETIKALVERLAHWKINELQLYIENAFTFKKHPGIGRGWSPYKPAELLQIQSHCKLHHVQFVPSLTSFGHMEKILMLPRYAKLGEMPGFRGLPGGTTLCPGDPGAIRLLADLYAEFLPLFDAEDFNACGDEPWELGKGRSKRRAARIGVGGVYLDFLLRLHTLCLKHGKRMNIWGDIVLQHPETIPRLPKDIVLLNWGYGPQNPRIPRTAEIVEADLACVCCPGTNGWQSHGTRMQTATDNVSVFARTGAKYAAEGLLNTDWGDGGHRNAVGVSLYSFSHGAAHGWHTAAVDDRKHLRNFTFHTFGDRTGTLAKALKILGDNPGNWAYHALVESLVSPRNLARGFSRGRPVIEPTALSPAQIRNRIEVLESLKWPKPAKTTAAYEAVALEEFALAAEMERLAFERLSMGKAARKGEAIPSAKLRKHAADMETMAEKFARLWNTRNRPSRLADNLAGFRNAAEEARKLGGR
ncbi:MAG: beta-N-acetylhexosaminidase [Kiritimatiellae bacterium]|nr:beta-N-acetylhexosaminidase [Kiritimatiellia bacterium]